MKAMTYSRFGPAAEVLRLTEIALPAPGPGEVLVDLAFSGVNPSDVKARSGARPGVTKPAFDQIAPHSDGAGVIAAVGAGVDSARIGQPVYVWNGQWQRALGTAASQILLPEAQAIPLPKGCTMEQGAVLGIPGMTAAWLVHGSGGVAEQTVLVQGGAGTVGYLAVQLAKHAGARVLATCNAKDADRVRAAGADAVFDYRDPDIAAQIKAAVEGGVDRIIEVEFGENIDLDTEVIATGGRIMAYGSAKNMAPQIPYGLMMFKALTVETVLVYLLDAEQRVFVADCLARAFADGALDIPIAAIHPFEACGEAHEQVEAAARTGAVLVKCN